MSRGPISAVNAGPGDPVVAEPGGVAAPAAHSSATLEPWRTATVARWRPRGRRPRKRNHASAGRSHPGLAARRGDVAALRRLARGDRVLRHGGVLLGFRLLRPCRLPRRAPKAARLAGVADLRREHALLSGERDPGRVR